MSDPLEDVTAEEMNDQFIYDADQSSALNWTHCATEDLLRLYSEYNDLYLKGKIRTKTEMFKIVGSEMTKLGYTMTPAQCLNRWKSLKRSYRSKLENSMSGKPNGKRIASFDEQVENILKKEKPFLRKKLYKISKVPQGYYVGSDEEEEIDEMEYTETDDALIQSVLSDRDTEVNTSRTYESNNIEVVYGVEDEPDHTYSFKTSSNKSHHSVTEKLSELKDIVKASLEVNVQLLKNNNLATEQIATYLESLERKEEEKLSIKRKKLERQTELVQQMKIQNSLIAKLIQKLGQNT
ncbi:uncharacterized protein LOC115884490 [Sitophilus oryzae]|uniref:Uncharacterized protein LOC115884490 n=1 Tax=Sitophilus oryzae TaxID=7048 RepID=A0A6J2Y5N4_SITOR|nr:uncharacterized protein LOC115884490 [Sitophilus oryzae]XP_030758947.1 uncharacterized protein LOC115884490 [Sitophilus oryzae]XP_030758948.1 uncharacterized protein LOC115884490 [Sitophilus oryzae]